MEMQWKTCGAAAGGRRLVRGSAKEKGVKPIDASNYGPRNPAIAHCENPSGILISQNIEAVE